MPEENRGDDFLGLFFLFLALYVGLSLFTFTYADPPAAASQTVSNWGGMVGAQLAYYGWTFLGWMSVFVVLALFVSSCQCFLGDRGFLQPQVLGSWGLVLVSGNALLSQIEPLYGGVAGTYLLDRLQPVIGGLGTTLVFSFLLLLGLTTSTWGDFRRSAEATWESLSEFSASGIGLLRTVAGGLRTGFEWTQQRIPLGWVPGLSSGPDIVRSESTAVDQDVQSEPLGATGTGTNTTDSGSSEQSQSLEAESESTKTVQAEVVSEEAQASVNSNSTTDDLAEESTTTNGSSPADDEETLSPARPEGEDQTEQVDRGGDPEPVDISSQRPEVDETTPDHYQLPTTEILSSGNLDETQPDDELLEDLSDRLEETFQEFNIDAEVVRVNPGPVLTMYEVQPGPGVSVKKIENRADDIKLSLAVESVRIVSPIPGKQAVGIEVPNPDRALVTLSDVVGTEAFQAQSGGLPIGLGLNVYGDPLVIDLADLPHLLVAGATGSGKSVCLNAIISSLMFKHNPWDLKFIMVDPKRVELNLYDGLPHLMTPVIDDPSDANEVLSWAVDEMERRYEVLSDAGKRDIRSYNEDRQGEDRMPYLVVIVDELADLMFINPKECEQSIQRLAQMARAVGIHMVLATQRPSTDVITGIIKANMPARLAFRVSSGTDSRVVLDHNGAETLLGNGDLLYLSSEEPQPRRAQGAFVSDEDTKDLIRFAKEQVRPSYVEEENLFQQSTTPLVDEDFDDEYYDQAKELVVERGKGSASMIQRQFRVGYNRAARMLDMMEEEGIVGPHQGSKAREVLVSQEELQEGSAS